MLNALGRPRAVPQVTPSELAGVVLRSLERPVARTALVLRGAPGVGKTRLARMLARLAGFASRRACVVSADDYRRGEDGAYLWTPATAVAGMRAARSAWAHELTVRLAHLIVSDNVNLVTRGGFSADARRARGWRVIIGTLVAPACVCVARGVHGAPPRQVSFLAEKAQLLAELDAGKPGHFVVDAL